LRWHIAIVDNSGGSIRSGISSCGGRARCRDVFFAFDELDGEHALRSVDEDIDSAGFAMQGGGKRLEKHP
jgi:hypothetical protein